MRRKTLLPLCLLVVTSASFGSVITFNDLSGNGNAIPNGYAGFSWTNFDRMAGMPVPDATAVGAAGAAQSFAVNRAGQIASFGSDTTFSLVSAWLSTEWNSQ